MPFISLNPISYYRANPRVNVYALVGYNVVASRVLVKDNLGDFHTFYGQLPNSVMSTVGGATINNNKASAVYTAVSYGAGIAFKVSNKLNIGIEQRYLAPIAGKVFLDGYTASLTNNKFSTTSSSYY